MKGPFYVLASSLGPIRNTFFFILLILVCIRLSMVLRIALYQYDPALTIIKFLGLWLPHYAAISLQLALFIGLMFGLAQMAKMRELDAMHSVGYGLHQLLAPVLGFSLGVWYLTVLIVGWVQPISLYASKVLLHKIEQSASILIAGSNTFIKYDGKTIMLDGLSSNQDTFDRVFVYETFADGKTITTTGSSGKLLVKAEMKDQQYFVTSLHVMELTDRPGTQPGDIVRASETSYSENIRGPLHTTAKSGYRLRGESEYEWTLGELLSANPGMPFRVESHKLSAELHYRLAQLIFVLLLPFIAAITVIEPRRNPGPLRILVSLIAVLGFYQYLSYGTSVSRAGLMPTSITIWIPLALIYCVVTLKFWRLTYKPIH